jgi:ABC-type Na+ efflux pump permease subunit
VDERTLGLLDTLGRALLWGAVAVVGLAVISAVAIAGSETTIPGLDEIQRENRGVVSVIALGAGITGAGLLAGLGAIVRLLVEGRRDAQEQGR